MEQRRLLRDSLFNLSASVLTAGLGLLAVPLFVSHLPTAAYADWIVVLATAKTALLVDFGIGWTIVHVVAAEITEMTGETRGHLRSAATLLTGLGIVFAIITVAVVWAEFGDLSGGYRAAIVAAGGVMAGMSYINNYSMGVLWGLRRFDLAGLIVTIEAAIQSAGVVIILFLDGNVIAVAAWEAIIVSAATLAKIVIADRLCPEAAFRPTFRWPTASVRLIRFSLASQITDGFSSVFWSLGVMIVGQIGSPAAVVTFHIAQKVPLAVIGFVTRAAEVTMPAASGAAADGRATIAISAARIAMALSVPAVVTMWIVARPFMTLWVGHDVDALTTTMRIAAVAVTAHALGESGRYFLWGAGRIGTIVVIQSIGAAILLIGAGLFALRGELDEVAFSAVQAVAVGVMSLSLSVLTATSAGVGPRIYATRIAHGIPLATLAAAAVGIGISSLWPHVSWIALGVVGAGIGGTFVALMAAFGLDADERTALRHLLRLPPAELAEKPIRGER